MPQNPVFDLLCTPFVEPITASPDDGWFVDVSIPAAPQTIADCGAGSGIENVPLPEPEAPCPTLRVGSNSTRFDPTGAGSAGFEVRQLDCCVFEFDLDVEFPCPQFSPTVVEGVVESVPPGEEYARIEIAADSDACAFVFDFALGLPAGCPQEGTLCAFLPELVEATTGLVPSGSEGATLTVTAQPFCTFDFALHVDFPVECPTVAAGTQTSTIVSGAPTASLSILDAGGCVFDIDFALGFTCPTFGGLVVGDVELVIPGQEYLRLVVTELPNCDFDLALEAGLPCPGLLIGPQLYGLVPLGQESSTIVAVESAPCTHALSSAMNFPCPQLLLGPLTLQNVEQTGSYGAFWNSVALDPCTTQLGLVVQMPQAANVLDLAIVQGGPTFTAWTDAYISESECQLCLTGTEKTFQIDVNADGLFLDVREIGEVERQSCVNIADCTCPQPRALINTECCEFGIPDPLHVTLSNFGSGCDYYDDPWTFDIPFVHVTSEDGFPVYYWYLHVYPDIDPDPICSYIPDTGYEGPCICHRFVEFRCLWNPMAEVWEFRIVLTIADLQLDPDNETETFGCDNTADLLLDYALTIDSCEPFAASGTALGLRSGCTCDVAVS